ncbi:MAG: LysR family transcriptional regulator [Stappiaceae bacterium]
MSRKRRLPPLQSLRVLEALYQTGSVTKAADYLNVTHSAVSHQIRQLEDWTGRSMVRRVGRQSRLTEEGESLARVAREGFDAIRHEIDRLPLRSKKPVSIAALPIVAAEWLVPLIPELLHNNNELSIHLSYALSDRPQQPEPDIVISFAQKGALDSDSFVLFSGEAAPVCTPTFLTNTDRDREGALRLGPHLYDEDLRMWRDWKEAAGPDFNPDSTPQIYLEGSSLLKASALAGLGVAICRLAFVQSEISSGELVQLSDVTTDRDWVYFVRSNPLRRTDTKVAEVLDWLRTKSRVC